MTNMSCTLDHSRTGAAAGDAEMDFTALAAFANWAIEADRVELTFVCERFGRLSSPGCTSTQSGLTEKHDVCDLHARQFVLCLAESDEDRLTQLAAVLAVGGKAIWPAKDGMPELLAKLPKSVRESIDLADVSGIVSVDFDIALCHGDENALQDALRRISARYRPIVGVLVMSPGSVDIPLEALAIFQV